MRRDESKSQNTHKETHTHKDEITPEIIIISISDRHHSNRQYIILSLNSDSITYSQNPSPSSALVFTL